MRVLMVHDEPIDSGYGAESYLRRLVGGLTAAGDDVEVVAGEVHHTGLRRFRDLWDPAARDLIEKRSREFRPDVIHFHNILRELSPSVLDAVPNVPAVMTVHDFRLLGAHEHGRFTARGRVERLVARQIRRLARRRLGATIGVSDRVSDGLRNAGFPSVSTVRVPVPVPALPPQSVTQCRDVAVVARLTRDKGADLAIDAFAAATAGHPDGRRILIAGDGPERHRLESRCGSMLTDGRLEFLGRLDEPQVSSLLGRVRAVIVASQSRHRPEGSSLSLAEAAMHGRPVVASNDPAVAEVAADLGNALVAGGWDAAGFGHELSRLLDDDDLAAELGERGRVNAQRLHSVEAVTEATRVVYREAIDGAAR
jgi:glycosyltransferase involved in cell wall biosynthesis